MSIATWFRDPFSSCLFSQKKRVRRRLLDGSKREVHARRRVFGTLENEAFLVFLAVGTFFKDRCTRSSAPRGSDR